MILSLYGRIRVSENPYSRIFYAVYIEISTVLRLLTYSQNTVLFNWNLNRGYLVYVFSLRF